ncbi:MAG: cytochrome C, partial [Gammaproteobacteria bacterium]|nr:cytochrome C [Gammaproteobacteria bacterium]
MCSHILRAVRRLIPILIGSLALLSGPPAEAAVGRDFDHFSTGFPLNGAHQRADCESCHLSATFKGTPTRCASCHTSGSRVHATIKPAGHNPVTDTCEDCHGTVSWSQV